MTKKIILYTSFFLLALCSYFYVSTLTIASSPPSTKISLAIFLTGIATTYVGWNIIWDAVGGFIGLLFMSIVFIWKKTKNRGNLKKFTLAELIFFIYGVVLIIVGIALILTILSIYGWIKL